MLEPGESEPSREAPLLLGVDVCGVEEELGVLSLPTLLARLDDVVAELVDDGVIEAADVVES